MSQMLSLQHQVILSILSCHMNFVHVLTFFCFTVPDLVPAPVFGHVGLAALEVHPGENQGPAVDIEVLAAQAPLPLPGIFLFT